MRLGFAEQAVLPERVAGWLPPRVTPVLMSDRLRLKAGLLVFDRDGGGHPEPWIIALSERPTAPRPLDYGLRWGIEAMFSDLKSRGTGALWVEGAERHVVGAGRYRRRGCCR